MKIFFYGLFMDERLLAEKGITPGASKMACASGYEIRIGERANLVARPDSSACGLVMELEPADIDRLYSEGSVSGYRGVAIEVRYVDGSRDRVSCYVLPEAETADPNPAYAGALHELAARLGFPETYLAAIRRAGRQEQRSQHTGED